MVDLQQAVQTARQALNEQARQESAQRLQRLKEAVQAIGIDPDAVQYDPTRMDIIADGNRVHLRREAFMAGLCPICHAYPNPYDTQPFTLEGFATAAVKYEQHRENCTPLNQIPSASAVLDELHRQYKSGADTRSMAYFIAQGILLLAGVMEMEKQNL